MAEGAVRKSSRIKSLTRMVYAEDDLDYVYDMHFDVSGDISSILESHSRQKNSGTRKKSFPNVSKKVNKMSKSGQQDTKSCAEDDNLNFGDVTVHTDGDSRPNSLADPHVTCPVCSKPFVSEKDMEDHMVEHQNEDGKLKGNLLCDICSRICVDQASYNRHMKAHSGGRNFKCEICDKAYTDSCSLKRHVKCHDDERPFTCDFCFKSFRDNPSLIRHHVTHTERPRMFQCLKCDKTFADKHSLKRHERTHTGLRPFECKTCLKTFSEPGSFKRHLKIHTGVRNFCCPICSRSFLEKQSLIRHQKNVCGFGDAGNASLLNSFTMGHSFDSQDSGAGNSEISHSSIGEGVSSILNENSLPSDSLNTLTSASLAAQPNFISPAGTSSCKTINCAEKSETAGEPKDAPSLHSLIQKDPDLYESISEIVERIDSYEKMLDLCGDTGQVELEAALTREPVPMPDNLLCFECGELLVNGDNFKSEGKSFHPSLCYSYKCMNCEDNDDFGEPPVLTAEMSGVGSSPSIGEKCDSDTVYWQLQEKLRPVKDDGSKNIFGTDESLEHLRERLRTQHGVFFVGDVYGNYDDGDDEESDTNDQADITSSNATTSRSHSVDSEVGQTSMDGQTTPHNPGTSENLIVNTLGFGHSQLDVTSKKSPSSTTEQQQAWTSITPRIDYEVGDHNIPSVFPCHLCTKVFATSAFLTRHLDLHKNSPHKCMVCAKTFTNSQSLKRHMNMHTGEKPYTCPCCSKRFRDPSNFSKHKKVCSASFSAPSPADSIYSASSVSSPQSLDDSSTADHARAYVADLKQKLGFPSHSSTTETLVSPDSALRFSYDNDDEEDLPVRFDHCPDDSDTKAAPRLFPETGGRSTRGDVKYEIEDSLLNKDENSVSKGTDEGDLLIPCTVCGKTFENEQFLEMHMKYHSGNPKVTCIECGKSFADQFGLKRHLRIHAGIRPHVCEYCGRGYCDNWSLKKHKSRGCMLLEIRVPADFLHPCPQCTRVFSELDYLEEHMKTHKGLLKFECDICQKKFSEAFNLKRHRRLHMAICPGCDREFRDIQSLYDHQASDCPVNIPRSVTGKEDGFPCPECGRVYSTKAYLERHKKFHSDLKPYVCEICNKRFSEAFRLRRHLKVHNDDRPFSCETCGKGFADVTSLKRHITSSSCSLAKEQPPQQGAVDFSCHLCDKVFTKNYLLARHMNVHSQERPFACDECGRTYKDTSSLRRHQLVHQGIKTFICSICGKDFFYADSLKRHVSGCSGKKRKSRRGRGRGRGRNRRKSNNNISMKNNNTIGKEIISPDPKHEEVTAENSVSVPHSPHLLNKLTYRAVTRARDLKIGHWSCHKRKQCWRCNLKFGTPASLLKHSRIHCHYKPYHCPHCFIRWARKLYWRVHLKTHKSKSEPRSKHIPKPAPVQQPVPKEEIKRPQRSIPRARWSWITKI